MYSALMLTIRLIYDSDTHEPIEHPHQLYSATIHQRDGSYNFGPCPPFLSVQHSTSTCAARQVCSFSKLSAKPSFAVGECGIWLSMDRVIHFKRRFIHHEFLRLRDGRWTLARYVRPCHASIPSALSLFLSSSGLYSSPVHPKYHILSAWHLSSRNLTFLIWLHAFILRVHCPRNTATKPSR